MITPDVDMPQQVEYFQELGSFTVLLFTLNIELSLSF